MLPAHGIGGLYNSESRLKPVAKVALEGAACQRFHTGQAPTSGRPPARFSEPAEKSSLLAAPTPDGHRPTLLNNNAKSYSSPHAAHPRDWGALHPRQFARWWAWRRLSVPPRWWRPGQRAAGDWASRCRL